MQEGLYALVNLGTFADALHAERFDYIRRLLVVGATAVMRLARQDNASRTWAAKLLERKSAKLAAVALANKTARIAWVVMTRGETYAAPAR